MKHLLLIISILITTLSFSQLTTINPDTVCINTNGSIYNVTNTPGYTYTWSVSSPGILVSGQGTNQINVDWSNSGPGLINNGITVFATGVNGCQSNPITLNVFILEIIPTISPIGPLCSNTPCVPLIGNPIGGTWSGIGVVGNEFCPTTSGIGTFDVTYTITQGGCTFTTTTSVIVDPIPVLTPIQHN